MRRATWLLWAASFVLSFSVLFPTASAFESVPPGDSVHDHITADAATPLGWNSTSLPGLQKAVLAPDMSESKIKLKDGHVIVLDVTSAFEPSHHCDRLPPNPDDQVFAATSSYVRMQRDVALLMIHANQPDRAVAALGRALHALQDCYSHSDISEQEPGVQLAFQQALLNDTPAPAGLRVAGFQPGVKEPEMPVGDAYPHGLFAKDGPHSNADAEIRLPSGQTKFETAAALATTTSRMFLEDYLSRLNVTEKASILSQQEVHSSGASFIPPVGAAMLLLIIPAVVWVRRRRSD